MIECIAFFSVRLSYAACTIPTAAEGAREWFSASNLYKICINNAWVDLPPNSSQGACSNLAELEYDSASSNYEYCDGTNWQRITCVNTDCNSAAATYTTAGTHTYIIPNNCTSVVIDVYGGGGGYSTDTVTVSAGEQLDIWVGGGGALANSDDGGAVGGGAGGTGNGGDSTYGGAGGAERRFDGGNSTYGGGGGGGTEANGGNSNYGGAGGLGDNGGACGSSTNGGACNATGGGGGGGFPAAGEILGTAGSGGTGGSGSACKNAWYNCTVSEKATIKFDSVNGYYLYCDGADWIIQAE